MIDCMTNISLTVRAINKMQKEQVNRRETVLFLNLIYQITVSLYLKTAPKAHVIRRKYGTNKNPYYFRLLPLLLNRTSIVI